MATKSKSNYAIRDGLTLIDRRILGVLPREGTSVGHHILSKTIPSIIADLDYSVESPAVFGALKSLRSRGLVDRAAGGWIATKVGKELIAEFDCLLVSTALAEARRAGGVARVAPDADSPTSAYVLTPDAYTALDPNGSATIPTVHTGAVTHREDIAHVA